MQKKLPIEWVDRIFQKLHGRFGNRFLDNYRTGEVDGAGNDVGVLNAKNEWALKLGDLTPKRILKGLDADFDYPPDADKFKKSCTSTPSCHRDNSLLALPKAKPSKDVVQKNLEKIRSMMKIKKVSA
jgi:hypothetical protein